MKHHLFLSLVLAGLCATASAAPEKASRLLFPPSAELGNVMFVGDSITHGVAAASYRWPLFKIFVDNGITLKEVGVHERNHSGGVQPGTAYGNATFRNVHSAISSERAYEIAGRINTSGRLENSNIHDWLGLDKGYNGKRRIDTESDMPAHFFMMIGTNDTLSDSGNKGIHTCIAETEKNLLGKKGDMDTIIRAMREGNPKARIAVTTIPTWAPGRHNNAAPEDYATIERYNSKLKAWGKANKVAVVEVNRGMVDMEGAKKVPFVGLPAMFGRDKLHPSAQGDLIIAGNVAQQLGYAGRTAGLPRKAASEFPMQGKDLMKDADAVKPGKKGGLTVAPGGMLEAPAEAGQAGTVEFRFSKKGFGKDCVNEEKPMTVTLSTGSSVGELGISSAGIGWQNGQVLYSADMSKLREPIRMTHVTSSAPGVSTGFYVWLGDMLIGEGLPGKPLENKAGLRINTGEHAASFASLSYDPAASWAPDSKRFSAGNPTFEGAVAPAVAPAVPEGVLMVKSWDDVTRLSGGSGTLSGGKDTSKPRVLVFDGAAVSAKVIHLADVDEVQLTNGSAVVLSGLGGAKKLIVDATSRLGLAKGEHEASVLNSGTIILPAGATLSLRAEGTDENETGTYQLNGGNLKANNVRMSNTIRVNGGGQVSGIEGESFRGKLEKK